MELSWKTAPNWSRRINQTKGTGTVEWDRNDPGTPGGEVPWCLLSQGMEVRRWSWGHQAASFSSCSGSYQEFKQHLRLMESCWDVLVTSS